MPVQPSAEPMKFATDCQLSAGKIAEIKCPNLARYYRIPNRVTISCFEDEEVPASGLQCRVYAGNTEIIHWAEPSFRLTNELDLSPFIGIVEKTGALKVSITNRSTDTKKLRVYTDYIPSYGSVLLEEKVDHFENVLNEIYNKGYCTRIVLSFNKPLESLEFAGVASCLEGSEHWIQPLNVPVDTADNDGNDGDQVYNIDLTVEGLGAIYSENLNFLELRAKAKRTDDDRSIFYMYVMAYGFPKGG